MTLKSDWVDEGTQGYCKCGEVSPNAAHWAAHVAHVLIPAAT